MTTASPSLKLKDSSDFLENETAICALRSKKAKKTRLSSPRVGSHILQGFKEVKREISHRWV